MTNQPNILFEDGFNFAVSPYSIDNIVKIKKMSKMRNLKTYIHVGVKISDFECDGFTIYNRFDCVFRSGTFASSYLLPNCEKFLILYGELMSLRGYFNEKG